MFGALGFAVIAVTVTFSPMAMTTQEYLDKVDTQIAALLDAHAIEEWSESSERNRKARLAELHAIRKDLVEQLSAEEGTSFTLASFIE